MSTMTDALARKPQDLGDQHVALARLLIGNPEGVTRRQGARRLGIDDRTLRDLIADIVAAGWLPIINDRGTTNREEGRYRLATSSEVDLVHRESAEIQARAMSLHVRARGLRDAFRAHHSAGPLFMPDVAELEGVA